MSIIKKLFSKDNTLIIFILSVVSLLLGIYLNNIFTLIFSSIFLFSSWDSFGFKYVLTQEGSLKPDKTSLSNAGYRIIQTTFQMTVAGLLYFISGIYLSLAFILGWWFGICDLIYYLCTKEKFWEWGDMTWVWWTPIGLILSVFKKDVPPSVFIGQAIIGLILVILIGLQFTYNFLNI